MITKERLEELIKEGAIVYTLLKGAIEKVDLAKISIFGRTDNYTLIDYWCDSFDQCIETSNERLFETEKQADWALNYTAERTDKLELPMWEEFKGDVFFNYKDIQYGLLMNNYFISIIYETPENGFSMIYKDWEPVTKENYEEACKLAIKLFKGE